MHVCQCCWSGKERWKSWEKSAPSHSPSHHQQSPRADYFLVIAWLIQPQALQVHGNFSSQCSEQPFFWGGCYDVFSIFLPFSKELADTIGAAWQAPNLAPVENGSSWMLHISWISHQTGYINDSDSPCISSFFQTCSLVKLCQKWHDWSFQGCCTRTPETDRSLARLCNTCRSTTPAACEGSLRGWKEPF